MGKHMAAASRRGCLPAARRMESGSVAEVIIVDPEFFLQRRREKAASRAADQARIDAGEDPEVLQKENSIFPDDFFKGAKISNLAETVGR